MKYFLIDSFKSQTLNSSVFYVYIYQNYIFMIRIKLPN